MVSGDTNAAWDIFVRDRLSGANELITIDSAGVQSNGMCGLYGFSMSSDGRYVVYYCEANNLVPGDLNGAPDVLLRDRVNGTTELVSISTTGVQGNARSEYPFITDDGRFVVFDSLASTLVPGDTNGVHDVFVRDRVNGTTERVSVAVGKRDQITALELHHLAIASAQPETALEHDVKASVFTFRKLDAPRSRRFEPARAGGACSYRLQNVCQDIHARAITPQPQSKFQLASARRDQLLNRPAGSANWMRKRGPIEAPLQARAAAGEPTRALG
jgi:hypothetical protein